MRSGLGLVNSLSSNSNSPQDFIFPFQIHSFHTQLQFFNWRIVLIPLQVHVWVHIHGGQCYTSNAMQCEKDRRGGRDGHHREEIVGSASSFIAALMSPGTHRLETAVLFPPTALVNKFYAATDTQKHMYIQSREITTYIVRPHTPIHLVRRTHTLLWFDQWNL